MALPNIYSMIITTLFIMLMINDFPEANEVCDYNEKLTNMAGFQYGFEASYEYTLLYCEFDGQEIIIRHILTRLYMYNYLYAKHKEIRFPNYTWQTHKLEVPHQYGPVLMINDKIVLTHTLATSRYLAHYAKLNGEGFWEEYLIDTYVQTMEHLRREFVKHMFEKDETKAKELNQHFKQNILQYFLKKFEIIVKYNNGYFLDSKHSWADVTFSGLIETINNKLGEDVLQNYEKLGKLRTFVLNSNKVPRYQFLPSVENFRPFNDGFKVKL